MKTSPLHVPHFRDLIIKSVVEKTCGNHSESILRTVTLGSCHFPRRDGAPNRWSRDVAEFPTSRDQVGGLPDRMKMEVIEPLRRGTEGDAGLTGEKDKEGG